jgi:hypothetical protein
MFWELVGESYLEAVCDIGVDRRSGISGNRKSWKKPRDGLGEKQKGKKRV